MFFLKYEKFRNLEHFLIECDRFRALRTQTIEKHLGNGGYASLLEKAMDDGNIFEEFVKYEEKSSEVRN